MRINRNPNLSKSIEKKQLSATIASLNLEKSILEGLQKSIKSNEAEDKKVLLKLSNDKKELDKVEKELSDTEKLLIFNNENLKDLSLQVSKYSKELSELELTKKEEEKQISDGLKQITDLRNTFIVKKDEIDKNIRMEELKGSNNIEKIKIDIDNKILEQKKQTDKDIEKIKERVFEEEKLIADNINKKNQELEKIESDNLDKIKELELLKKIVNNSKTKSDGYIIEEKRVLYKLDKTKELLTNIESEVKDSKTKFYELEVHIKGMKDEVNELNNEISIKKKERDSLTKDLEDSKMKINITNDREIYVNKKQEDIDKLAVQTQRQYQDLTKKIQEYEQCKFKNKSPR